MIDLQTISAKRDSAVTQPTRSSVHAANWIANPEFARRAPILLCLTYCLVIFYLKAAAHIALDIPHVDDDFARDFIPQALWLIALSLFPAMAILLAVPIAKYSHRELITRRQLRLVVSIAIGFSFLVCSAVILQRGSGAFSDVYGNRLLVEHGIFAPLTILMTPFIFSTVVALALSDEKRTFLPVALLCLSWGVFLAKGSMLAYPLLIYVFIRGGGRRWFLIFALTSLVLGIAAVVLLGRLRQGNDVTAVFDDDGLLVLLTLFLHRIDQLDSLALVLSQRHLEYSLSLWDECVKTFVYLLPRDLFPDKPLSFSMEITKELRPWVFANDAANNFTVFAQAFLVAGSLGTVLCFLIFLFYFYSVAFVQRFLFPTYVGFWTFNLSVVVPCFMSLVGAGLFREYVVLEFILSIPGLIIFFYFFRRVGNAVV